MGAPAAPWRALAQVGLAGGLGPEILLGLAGRELAVDDVADAGEDDDEQQLLHGPEAYPGARAGVQPVTDGSDIVVGLGGLEPPTSSLSGKRSNQTELQARTSPETT